MAIFNIQNLDVGKEYCFKFIAVKNTVEGAGCPTGSDITTTDCPPLDLTTTLTVVSLGIGQAYFEFIYQIAGLDPADLVSVNVDFVDINQIDSFTLVAGQSELLVLNTLNQINYTIEIVTNECTYIHSNALEVPNLNTGTNTTTQTVTIT